MNASGPAEHPPVRGENVKTLRWDHRLQIQNLFVVFNAAPFSYRNRTPHLYVFFSVTVHQMAIKGI